MLTTNIGSGLKKTIDVTLPTREREQIANDVGSRWHTGKSVPYMLTTNIGSEK